MINRACTNPTLRKKLTKFFENLDRINNDSNYFYKGTTPKTLQEDLAKLERHSKKLAASDKNKHSAASWAKIHEKLYPLIRSVRPYCDVDGCNRKAQHLGATRKDGTIQYRYNANLAKYICTRHHHEHYDIGRGAYQKYRLEYCENLDSRLGYKCTTTIKIKGQLTVDHIDGDPSNNDPANLQTLCQCCHTYKSHLYEDWKTAGRKALGVK